MLQQSFGVDQNTRRLSVFQTHQCDFQEIFVVRYDPDDTYLATGLGNGDIQLFNIQLNERSHNLKGTSVLEETATTCLRWRPPVNQSKHILVSGNCDGSIIHWHAPSGKRLHKMQELNNSILSLDFNYDGSLFATGGKDFKIRIYDDDIKSLYHTYQPADWGQRGHSNRVFSIKFLPDQPNILISGGWDSNILIWDARDKSCIGQFYGPSISGDSLDYQSSTGLILSGSYRTQNQLQLWDFRTRKLFKEIKWMGQNKQNDNNDLVYIYTAQFSKINDDLILAGSCGLNEIKLFDKKKDYAPCGSIEKIEKGIYSVDFANTENKFAYGGGEGMSAIIQYQV